MGWRTRTRALPIRDLRQIAYLLPMWGGSWSGVVFVWRRLICPQNSSLRMFRNRDLNSSDFFPRFGLLKHEAKRTPDMSATIVRSHEKFSERNRISVGPARNEIRVLCLSPTGWIVSIGAAEEELCLFESHAKIWSVCGITICWASHVVSILSFKGKPMSYTISIAMRTLRGVLIDSAANAEATAQPHFIRLLIDHFFLFYPHRNLYTEEKTPPNKTTSEKKKKDEKIIILVQ